eukprot:767470-Karenia_brevis.AAC.1
MLGSSFISIVSTCIITISFVCFRRPVVNCYPAAAECTCATPAAAPAIGVHWAVAFSLGIGVSAVLAFILGFITGRFRGSGSKVRSVPPNRQ